VSIETLECGLDWKPPSASRKGGFMRCLVQCITPLSGPRGTTFKAFRATVPTVKRFDFLYCLFLRHPRTRSPPSLYPFLHSARVDG
jgi:hypothetical protein